jgi:predicted transcriptional regulator
MSTNIRDSAIEAIRGLPEDCTWEDVQYKLYVKQKLQEGMEDIEAGRVLPHDEVFAEYQK